MEVVLYDGKPEERKQVRDEYLVSNNFNVLLTHYDYILKDKSYLSKVCHRILPASNMSLRR